MSSITPGEALKQIAAGDLAPVYLVLGDDDLQKGEVADAFEQAVDEGLRAFNVEHLDGAESTLRQVVEAAATLPMMAPRRIVIVRRAERCLAPKRETGAVAADLAVFEEYLAGPYPHACLVLVASGLDRRRRTTTRLLGAATQVLGDELASVADAERWVRRRVSAAGRAIDAAAARLVAARAGPDLPRLRGEVDRLLLFVGEAPTVGLDDARVVAGPAVAHDDWAVARAIERGQAAAALKELALVVESGAAPYMVLGQLAWVVRTKMPNHRVAAAVESLYRTDLDLKSSAGDHRVLLERLVAELCDA
jgi:DNA polymerase-3 subunit delta